ncbi:MAG: hemolysin family protein [Candidatus Midichloria sp.]|nr:MAG: hemolysin family protein [Candidatus Midichloria sp.]
MAHFLLNASILIILIMMTSLFVSAEIAIIASRKSRLNSLSKKNKAARKALDLASRPEDFLSTVQVGITLINVMIGIYGGAAISADIANLVGKLEILYPYREEISYALVVILITYFTVLGEIIPKRIAMLYPERVASLTSYLMLFFTKLFYPFVKLLALSTKYALKILKIKEPKAQLTMEELRIMVNQAEVAGMLAATEHDMLCRIIHLSNTQVGAIMTPRNKMIWIDIRDKERVNIQKMIKHPFHYLPVVEGGLSNVIGIATFENISKDELNNRKISLKAQNSEVIYIPETARVSKLIDLFREKKVRIALVVDEYGDIEGLVTLNDVLKILVGDLAIGMSDKTPDIIKNSDNSYTVNGNILTEEVMSLLGVSSLPGDEEEDYRTLAGFMLSQIGQLPKIGDNFNSIGWSFSIVKMDKRRIERVLLRKTAF